MITNYGELQAAIKTYLYNRKDLDSDIVTFISIAEQKIFRTLRAPENEKLLNVTIAEGMAIPEITEPTDFLEIKFMLMDDRPLRRISDIEMKTRLSNDFAQGRPSVFARVLNKYEFWRRPDSNYSVDMYYWSDFSDTPLTVDGDTNPVLTKYPELYLYGALLEAMPFLADDTRLATYQALYKQALDYVDHQTKEQEYSGSPVAVSSVYSDPIRGIQSGRRL